MKTLTTPKTVETAEIIQVEIRRRRTGRARIPVFAGPVEVDFAPFTPDLFVVEFDDGFEQFVVPLSADEAYEGYGEEL